MKLIVNVNQDWGIGTGGDMLVAISEDLKRFKRLTSGCAVVMGYKTLVSLPGSRPLPGRDNYVLSRKESLSVDGAVVVGSLESLLELLGGREDVFVIGGESVYRLLLPYCDYAYITKSYVEKEADTYFPNLDEDEEWEIVSESESYYENGVEFKYVDYRRDVDY